MHSTATTSARADRVRTRGEPGSIGAGDHGLCGRCHPDGHGRPGGHSLAGLEGVSAGSGFLKTLLHQLSWMLITGFPLVGIVHIAMGSFLSLQAYYGQHFCRRHGRGCRRGAVA